MNKIILDIRSEALIGSINDIQKLRREPPASGDTFTFRTQR
jgi:hypothetical protein